MVGYMDYMNLTKHEIHYNDPLYALAQIVQLISIFIAILIIVLALYIFLKVPQYHKNMMALIVNLFIEGILIYLCKICLIIEWFMCYDKCYDNSSFLLSKHLFYIEILKLALQIAWLTCMPFVIIERTLATIQLKTYETHINYIFIVYCIVSQYIGGAVITYIIYNEIINIPISFIFGEIVCFVFTFVGFLFVYMRKSREKSCEDGTLFVIERINKLRYKQSTTIGTSYTLSERFQLSENIRSSRLMTNAIIVSTIGNVLIILFFAWSWSVNDFYRKRWIKFAYDFGVALYGIVFPIVGLLSSDIWTRMLFTILGQLRQVIPLTASTTSDSLDLETYHMKTTTGKKMVFTIEQEQNVYFEQLTKSWSTPKYTI